MAKYIVAYLLEADGTIPLFISSGGGEFLVGYEMVGISVDDTERFLPDTVNKLTKDQLITRAQSMGLKHRDGSDYTLQDVTDLVTDYLNNNGMQE